MGNLLKLVIEITNEETLPGHPITARIPGCHVVGCGTSVESAIEDLFTTRRATLAALELERAAMAPSDLPEGGR